MTKVEKADRDYFNTQKEAVEDTWKNVNFYIDQIPEKSLREMIKDYANERIYKKRFSEKG